MATFKMESDEALAKMSLAELEHYREVLEAQRVAFREHASKVAARFRDLNDAINQTQRIADVGDSLRVVPGVALAQTIRAATLSRLGKAAVKGGSIMLEAAAPDPADKPESGN